MPPTPPPVTPHRRSGPWAPIGAAVVGIEALLLLGLAAAYAVGAARHTEASLGRTLASMVLFLIGAAILGSMARAWVTGGDWQRMATLVLNALMIPVAITVLRGNGPLIGVPVLLLAVVGVVAALRAGAIEGPETRSP